MSEEDPNLIEAWNGSNWPEFPPRSHIIGRYWLGEYPSVPPPENFKLLALCAAELPHPPEQWEGATVGGGDYGFHDEEGNRDSLIKAWAIAAQIQAWTSRNDGDVLVTCQMGLNRSALTLGLVLGAAGISGTKIVEVIQKQRLRSLSNPDFRRWLLSGPLVP